jgi:hypothetical protein
MKKGVLVALIIAGVLMLACIIILAMGYRRQGAMYAESVRAEEAVRTQFNTALESIAEIQDSLTAIAPEETSLRRLSQHAEVGERVTQTQKERMLSTIADLRESIKNTRERIRDLEKNLKGSQTEVAGLKRIIENLKRSVSDKEAMILRLTAKVDSLTVTVTNLKTDVIRGQEKIAEQQQVIEDKRKEIGTIYYIVGTRKDLKNTGIINESGGVLGMGKSVQLSGAFVEGYFTPLDTDSESQISILGKEPVVLSAQAKSSYQLTMVAEGQSTLRILNAAEFRKVKYLVIMIK